ncbi:SDR family NAD(P)-dependent oxidoreductase [Actinoplanes derwentensis]|uniref:NAD(P)-dependent dehydrogenase, short-chain alcohol dehydrogenase family n=1 Tax=Actinoplanes derwentensis TaxID=113562 RepID=A0A1H1WMG9_9ACTN|nr:SDR family NAD(P)-dependent oxidoreductase [Actinoplanes derwentensis]GID87050.1 hypothetical protein Ade03nite_59740 [Actinoplanes derwentensis]SDS98254.1 NAD(P)-dependent dehydrogenase, short-chain alcohol dehydrogenase family [Actinoplanes derwentensis]
MAGLVVIGAGPGIGRSVAARFAREGLPVTLIARTPGPGVVSADCTDESALRAALDTAATRFGPPEVVVYNAALIQADTLGELPLKDLQEAWAVNVGGILTTAAHLLPATKTFLITGGMPEPKPAYVSLSLGKAAARTVADLLQRQFGPQDVHVATVTVTGPVAPGTFHDPDTIAEHYWDLHREPRPQWRHEVIH